MKKLLLLSSILLSMNPIAVLAHPGHGRDTSFSTPKRFICNPEWQRNNHNYLAQMNCSIKLRTLDSNRRLEKVDRESRLIYGTPTREDIRYYNRQYYESDCIVRNQRLYCAR